MASPKARTLGPIGIRTVGFARIRAIRVATALQACTRGNDLRVLWQESEERSIQPHLFNGFGRVFCYSVESSVSDATRLVAP